MANSDLRHYNSAKHASLKRKEEYFSSFKKKNLNNGVIIFNIN